MSEQEFARFEQWAASEGRSIKRSNPDYAPRPYVSSATNNALEGWQAALSTRKSYWYGIVDKGGQVNDYGLGASDKTTCEYFVDLWNSRELEGHPFRVVELFYEDSES